MMVKEMGRFLKQYVFSSTLKCSSTSHMHSLVIPIPLIVHMWEEPRQADMASCHRCHRRHHCKGDIPTSRREGPVGISHETATMAIKKPITSSAPWLTSAFCM